MFNENAYSGHIERSFELLRRSWSHFGSHGFLGPEVLDTK